MLLNQFGNKVSKIGFSSRISTMSYYFSGGHIEAGDQGLGAMPLIFKFTRLGLAGSHRQIWRYAFQSLNSSHLIDTES
jgi:hypothetical protein